MGHDKEELRLVVESLPGLALEMLKEERDGTELVDTVESVVDPEAVKVIVVYLPYQDLELRKVKLRARRALREGDGR